MKPLCLAVCLLSLHWALAAAEQPQPPSSPPAVSPKATSDDTTFRDPFAAEPSPTKPAPKVSDPLEPMNRAFYRFNDKFYFWVLKPAAKGYTTVTPQPFRVCMGRFFANVKCPVHMVNNLLQGHLKDAGLETSRFVINSTIGLAGFFDPAAEWKINSHPADFDQTLGVYHLPPGVYLDWPIFGPSSIRGTAGMVADGALAPWGYIDGLAVSLAVPAYNVLNSTSLKAGEYESFKKATFDPYVAMRSAYTENRRDAVNRSKEKLKKPKSKSTKSKVRITPLPERPVPAKQASENPAMLPDRPAR